MMKIKEIRAAVINIAPQLKTAPRVPSVPIRVSVQS